MKILSSRNVSRLVLVPRVPVLPTRSRVSLTARHGSTTASSSVVSKPSPSIPPRKFTGKLKATSETPPAPARPHPQYPHKRKHPRPPPPIAPLPRILKVPKKPLSSSSSPPGPSKLKLRRASSKPIRKRSSVPAWINRLLFEARQSVSASHRADQIELDRILSSTGRRSPSSSTGLRSEQWGRGWGKDELAPPSDRTTATRAELEKLLKPIHPRTLVPVSSLPTTPSDRGLPPHHVPWSRQQEGYIKDVPNAGQSGTSSVLRDVKSPSEHKPIAQLAHGLDRVLFNPGVHWLQDPRSRVYNFTPWLESIPKVNDFDFDRITGFVKSSSDTDLWTLAKEHGRTFTGSTSSLTGLLGHIYFLISGDKMVDTSSLTQAFVHQPTTFTPGQRMPTSVILNYREGVWSIDSDKAQDIAEKNVLTWMGTMLEKFLTLPEREFKKLLRSSPPPQPDADERREAYRYAMSERFVMRSQLDSFDPRLPGTGVFDIKTRAAVPIRLDILNYEENSGYLIKTLTGPLESFEKEYYDLIRNAFLKYSFQARIGNMDGVLVAYHNTARIFGFQYVSLEEMEQRLYGVGSGARVFDKCVLLMERVMMDVVGIYGERSIKCTFETRELTNELTIWVEPAEWDERVKRRPRPIKQLGVRVTNFLDGVVESGSRAVESDREWTIRWTLTEAAYDEAEIRRRLQGAYERQLKELNFPSGIETTEEMVKVWQSIDFGGSSAATSASTSATSATSATSTSTTSASELPSTSSSEVLEQPSSEEVPEPPSSELTSTALNFRQPDGMVLRLRQLAVRGREETLREEAEGREKVVWGAPEGWCWRDGGGESEGVLPGDGERVDVRDEGVGGEVVGRGDGDGDGDGNGEVRGKGVDRRGWWWYYM